ncbi:MAG: signal peptidase I [Firmicutes bacterium]|nr:signal peptidase I [Bacillota bacterium]
MAELEKEQVAEAVKETAATAVKTGQKISEWTGWKGFLRDAATVLVLAGLILTFIKPSIVMEHSMENSFVEGDYIILLRQHYRLFSEIKRGDIIVFHSSMTTGTGRSKDLIKRVIALPGETITISGGVVYIDGKPLDEPYTKDGYTGTVMSELTVPDGMIFVMGDNRQNSIDSRALGCIDQKQIIGKAVLRLFPLGKFGTLYKDLPY